MPFWLIFMTNCKVAKTLVGKFVFILYQCLKEIIVSFVRETIKVNEGYCLLNYIDFVHWLLCLWNVP